jgi:hypothetical protein
MKLDWTLHPPDQFRKLAPTWDALNQQTSNLPFLDSLFIAPLLDVFGKGNEVIALCRSGTELVAAAIVHKVGAGRWETFQPSQLPLGPLLMRPGLDLEALGSTLLTALPGINVSLGLTQLDPLYLARPDNQGTSETLDYIDTAWVEVTGSFDDYWNARGKNLRQNMRKQRNRLAKEGAETKLETIREAAEIDQVIRDYGTLEAASWKADTGTAITADNDQGRFYATMLKAFCDAGRGVAYRYRLNGQVVAVDLCIEAADMLVILKTTYDASDKSLSPAFLMREEQFAQLWAEGRTKRIEFYGKVMEWHTRWTEQARTLYHATLFRWTAVKAVKGLRHKLRNRSANASHQPVETPANEQS